MSKKYDSIEELLKDNNVVYRGNFEPMVKMGEKLKYYVRKFLRQYYVSYSPKVYRRTRGLINSVQTGANTITISGDTVRVAVWFNERADGSSMFSNGSSKMPKALLIDKGWKVKKNVWFKKIDRFGRYQGSHFIDDAIAEFKQYLNGKGVDLQVHRSDKKR